MKRKIDDAALITDYVAGMTWADLQEKYNCSVTTVYDVLVRNDIERKRNEEKSWSVEQDELFKKMYSANCTYPEIKSAFGIQSSTITWHVHRLGLPMRGSGRNNNYHNRFADRTAESDYWLGYIFADGHITYSEKERNGCGVDLFSEKEYVIDKFCQWFGEGVRTYSRKYKTEEGEIHTLHSARIGSKQIAKWFHEDLGVASNKHHSLNPTIELNWDIIRGYFDGDGSMTRGRGLCFKSCSKAWLERIRKYLESYGIKCYLHLSYRDCYGLSVYDRDSLEKMLIYMYSTPYYCHEYKHSNLSDHISSRKKRKR